MKKRIAIIAFILITFGILSSVYAIHIPGVKHMNCYNENTESYCNTKNKECNYYSQNENKGCNYYCQNETKEFNCYTQNNFEYNNQATNCHEKRHHSNHH